MHVVYRALTDAGLSVWTDEGLAVGTHSWENAIEQAIKEAEFMVVLMSPDAKQSKWVNIEVKYGLGIGLHVLPVLIRGELQESVLFSLYDTQFEDARGDLPGACEQLMVSLQKLAGVPVQPGVSREPIRPESVSETATETRA